MNTHRPFQRIVAASLGAALLSAGAGALADPPSRIARLAYISGPVSLAPAGENNWEYASLNRPLIPGDRLWVEPGARDELQVGGAALRMDGNTMVTLLNMDDRVTQLQLSQGRLNVRVRKLRPNDVFEIDTPNLALSIRQPGDYRIEVDPAGNATMVAVRRGLAEAYGDGNAYRLGSGQAYSFAGTDLRDVQYARPRLDDDFDRWSASRDRRLEQARSVRYVSPDMIGYEDLDEQGTWSTVPSYGNVWMPAHVGPDWAPYRDGHWAYVQPWGWTWVDDAPWGFAVSHYGRWARFPAGWGWVPGPRAASPVYAPALVAFISIGSGAYAQRERPVAWFPLAPREVYRPSYRASPTYITNINITNTTLNRSEVGREDRRDRYYANRQVGGAVTAVPATAFVRAQPVSRAALAVPVAALAGAAIAHTAPVAPERDGMRGRGNAGHQPPQAVMARQVLAKNAPPPEFRQAPQPARRGAPAQANVPGQAAPLIAGPAPRVLPQDRHGGRQLREVPMQPPVAGANPDVRAAQAMQAARPGAPQAMLPAAPQPNDGRFGQRGDQRMNGHRNDAQAPGQVPGAPVANAPATGMPQAPMPMPPQGHGRDRMPPPLAHAPTPVVAPAAGMPQAPMPPQGHGRDWVQPPPLAHAPTPVVAPAPAGALRDQQNAPGQQRGRMRPEQAGQPAPAAQPRLDQQAAAAQAQAVTEQQRNQQQATAQQLRMQQAAADQQRAQQRDQQHAAAEQQRAQQHAAEQQRAQQQAAEQQRVQQQAAAQQRAQQQQAAEQQRVQQAAAQQRAQQQQAAEQQRVQQQAAAQQRAQQQQAAEQQRPQQQAAAEQRRAERQQRHEAPAPQPAPAAARAAPPPPPAAQPASAPQQGSGNEGKKEDKRHRDRPEQN